MYGYHGGSVIFTLGRTSSSSHVFQLQPRSRFQMVSSPHRSRLCPCFVVIPAATQRSLFWSGGQRAGATAGRRDRAPESRTLPAKGEAGPHVPAGE